MTNEEILKDLIKSFYLKIKNNDFIIDKTGVKCVENISYSISKLSPVQKILDFGVKKTNVKYCEKELNWYLSNNLSIINYVDDVKIWNDVCTKDEKKEINSNYGWIIYSDENFNQFEHCLNELNNNELSRRAEMIYQRPSMWVDFKRNGMSDFVCTDNVKCYIRKNKLIYCVDQRSCDFIFGLFNDLWWHQHVYNQLYFKLKEVYSDLKVGFINFYFGSIHVYERHFDLLKLMYENNFNKCLRCMHGAIVVGERNSVYMLKESINKERIIDYKNLEKGCRKLNDIEKSNDCLNNNFKYFEELK